MGERKSIELPPFPLVGRTAEMEIIHTLLNRAAAGHGGTLVLHGEGGVGKSRLLRAVEAEAARMGWNSAVGRAYPVECGIPYAPFSDAFTPLLRMVPAETLATLTRGCEADLSYLFPMLRQDDGDPDRTLDAGEIKTRILWNFSQFLSRFASRKPLLLILDDLQWADSSSVELLHFLARQVEGERIAIVCAFNDRAREQRTPLDGLMGSLGQHESARFVVVRPLTELETESLIERTFAAEATATREFVSLLYRWTRGNPFFIEEILEELVRSGRLYRQGRVWFGWELEEVGLPTSVREALERRLATLSPTARQVADLMAVVGSDTPHDALRWLTGLDEVEVIARIDELRQKSVVAERLVGSCVTYDFTHPLVRETLYQALGLAHSRHLHERVAEALEAFYGDESDQHAGLLAYHFARTSSRQLASKAIHYLTVAGHAAVRTYANREAVDYLTAALNRAPDVETLGASRAILEDLARARQRLGEFEAAMELWKRARDVALTTGEISRVGRIDRRLGSLCHLRGEHVEALSRYSEAFDRARKSDDPALQVQVRLSEAECLLEMGNAEEARGHIQEALEGAERIGNTHLLAYAHLASLFLNTWAGPTPEARVHGEQSLALANQLGDKALGSTAHWGLTMLAGFTGDHAGVAKHSAESSRLADELRSPLHRLRVAELRVEYHAMIGEWETGLVLGERSIATARALNQRALLARLLVWTALIHLGRGSFERGGQYVAEAWDLSGADRRDRPNDVHTVIAANIGRAAQHLASGEFESAVKFCQAGVAIADRAGYRAWALHRLLPMLGEAYFWLRDLEGATAVGLRLRKETGYLGLTLGLAWADACDAVLVWLRGDISAAVEQLRGAAGRLETIGMVPAATRLRRHLAARLRDCGEREQALIELRRVHDVFARMGADFELAKTREQIRELGARPPTRESPAAANMLSSRELEIAQMVSARQSNKAIAKALAISPRTVGTHLTNIFRKLEVETRGELNDAVHRMDLGRR